MRSIMADVDQAATYRSAWQNGGNAKYPTFRGFIFAKVMESL